MTEQLPVPLPPFAMARLGAAALQPASPPPACHRCGTAATASWPRTASDDEREQHWSGLEQHIRSQPNLFDDQNANYTADREAPVTKAVFGCDEHDLSPTPNAGGAKAAMLAKQAGADARTLTHDADCGGHGECQCGGAE